MDLQLVAENLGFPEGPVALSDGSILVTEIRYGVLARITLDGQRRVVAETGGGPNGAAIGPDGAVYITNNGGLTWRDRGGCHIPGPLPPNHKGGSIQRVDLHTGRVTTLYEDCEDERLIAPNDLVFDRSGGFWFTDHGCSTRGGRRFGALYYAQPDGSEIVRARSNLLSPNGVGLSPDETKLYVADTMLARLWAFDIEGPGRLKPPEGFAPGRVICNLQGYQQLDSLAVEAGGVICVGTLVKGGVTAINPTGENEHFAFPDFATTNLCFGGADMRDVWVTCSSTGKLYKCRWPRSGLKLNFNA